MKQQHNKIIKMVTKACDLCGEIGPVEAVELLPGGGILFECKHEDGKTHEWGEYENMVSYRNIKIDRGINPEMKCPKCTEIGVIKTERDDDKRPDRYSYRISHPDGHRCRMSGNNRVEVLKYLNRYIPSDPDEKVQTSIPKIKPKTKWTPLHQRTREQIICPSCNTIGSAACYSDKHGHLSYRVFHNRGDGTNYQHLMKTFDEMIDFFKKTGSDTLDKIQRERLELKIYREYFSNQDLNADKIRRMNHR